MTKQMKDMPNSFIEIEKGKIIETISSLNEFTSEDGNIFIKKWLITKEDVTEPVQKEENKYISIIKKDSFLYSGTLNDKFQRDGYGLEIFSNGDKYLGQFDSDLRAENGIYYFSPVKNSEQENSENVHTECYLGQWNRNLKNRNGIYIWMDQPVNNYEYENANFDSFVGEFEEEKYLRGTYMSKSSDRYYIYHGNFSKDGKKNDNNAYSYYSKTNKIFHGQIQNDALKSGFMGTFDDESETITEIVYCKFNENGSVNDVLEEKQLNEEDIEEEKKNMVNFRSVIFDVDYFGKIYNKFNKIKIKIDRLEDMIGILETEENISEVDKILNKYTKKNIYFDIEEHFFGREI